MNHNSLRKNLFFILVFFSLVLINYFFRGFTFSFSTLDWDELTYFIMGKSIVSGYLPYRDFWDLKPIGIYLLHAITLSVFDYSILTLRLSALFFSTLASFIVFISLKGLNFILRFFLSICLLYLFMLFHSGLASNTEIYFLVFEALAFYLIFISESKFTDYFGFFALGFAFLIKYIIVFDVILFFVAYFLILLFGRHRKKRGEKFKESVFYLFKVALVFLLPFLISFLFYFFNDASVDYIEAIVFLLRGHSRLVSLQERFHFLFQLRFLFGLVVFLLLVNFYRFKSVLKDEKVIISFIWIFTSSLGAIWTGFLYEHYLLAILVPLLFLIGFSLSPITLSFQKKKYFNFILILGILSFSFVSVKNRNHLEKTLKSIPDQGEIVAQAIRGKISLDTQNQKRFFIAQGTHSPYILLDQLPPVKWVQPNNYSERIFLENLNLNINEIFVSLNEQSVSIISWCYPFSMEDVVKGKVKDNELSEIYSKKLYEYLTEKGFKREQVNPECSLYYL